MRVFLLCDGEAPSLLVKSLGPSWFRLINGTGLDAAKFITRESGGSQDKREIWNLIEIGVEQEEEALRSLLEAIKSGIRDEGELAVDLTSSSVPLHLLEEVARRSGALVVLGAIFTPDPEATQEDG